MIEMWRIIGEAVEKARDGAYRVYASHTRAYIISYFIRQVLLGTIGQQEPYGGTRLISHLSSPISLLAIKIDLYIYESNKLCNFIDLFVWWTVQPTSNDAGDDDDDAPKNTRSFYEQSLERILREIWLDFFGFGCQVTKT